MLSGGCALANGSVPGGKTRVARFGKALLCSARPPMILGPADQSGRTVRSFCIAFDGGVIAKETQHIPSRVWPARIGVGARRTSARPSMAGSMDAPLLQDCLPVRIGMDRAGVCMAAGYLSAANFLLPFRGSHGATDDMIGVSGVYYGVTIAVENNGRDWWPIVGSGRSRARVS
jgi:hypothetical protein